MNAEVFVDTNVLLYAIDDDSATIQKREIARQLLLTQRWGWSIQVAAEFFVNATSPKRPFRLSSRDDMAFIETWLAYPTAPLTVEVLQARSCYTISSVSVIGTPPFWLRPSNWAATPFTAKI